MLLGFRDWAVMDEGGPVSVPVGNVAIHGVVAGVCLAADIPESHFKNA